MTTSTKRKLTATFSDGAVLTRTTTTETLTHAWRALGANYWETDKQWHDWSADGFSSGRDKAFKAANSRGYGKKKIYKVEIVECVAA